MAAKQQLRDVDMYSSMSSLNLSNGEGIILLIISLKSIFLITDYHCSPCSYHKMITH